MSDKFCPLEVFFAFKSEVIKDEARKEALNDVNLQLKNLFENVTMLDNSRRNILTDQ